jgi:hypothetical protein
MVREKSRLLVIAFSLFDHYLTTLPAAAKRQERRHLICGNGGLELR